MQSMLHRLALGLALTTFFAGAACAKPPQPLLWKLSKGDSTVYLLGSMHFLKDDDYPLSPDVNAAYKDAEKLVFEIAPGEMNSPSTMLLTIQHGMYHDPNRKLQDDLPASTWKELVAYGTKNKLSEATLQKFEPWMASLTLVAIETEKMGMKPEMGLDMHFMQMASTDHKPTAGLETVDQQLAIFYNSPLKLQQDMLLQSLDEIANFKKEMDEEHDEWRRGDVQAMLADSKKEFAKYPELYQKLLAQRNRNWIPQIEKMLNEHNSDTLVIVGALHLPGPDGVVHLLQQKGYTVERICTGCKNIN
ncbi:MAG: TraB/GumN family protein [Lysobacteraceae bacterium]